MKITVYKRPGGKWVLKYGDTLKTGELFSDITREVLLVAVRGFDVAPFFEPTWTHQVSWYGHNRCQECGAPPPELLGELNLLCP